jgi:type VI secretion system protein ImpA
MPAIQIDLESLLTQLPDARPSGEDLAYDPEFLALERAGAGKPEQEYGDTKIPAKPPDWPAVVEHALQLAGRTRDLRVAVWLLRGGARTEGFGAALAALQWLAGLLERHWEHLHPQLDASESNPAQMRLAALAPLSPQGPPFPGPPPILDDLRAAPLTGERGSIKVRDVELGMGAADPIADEPKPTEAGVLEALRALASRHADLLPSMRAALVAIDSTQQTLTERLGAAEAPDLKDLRKLLAALDLAAQRASGAGLASAAPAGSAVAAAPAAVAAGAGAVNSREDVSRAIDELCEWIERNEPSNPAPLLLRRAQRLLDKSFLEIMRDLAPDGMEQVLRLAGSENTE